MTIPIPNQPHLPGLEPSYTQEELEQLSVALDAEERFEWAMWRFFQEFNNERYKEYRDRVSATLRSVIATDQGTDLRQTTPELSGEDI